MAMFLVVVMWSHAGGSCSTTSQTRGGGGGGGGWPQTELKEKVCDPLHWKVLLLWIAQQVEESCNEHNLEQWQKQLMGSSILKRIHTYTMKEWSTAHEIKIYILYTCTCVCVHVHAYSALKHTVQCTLPIQCQSCFTATCFQWFYIDIQGRLTKLLLIEHGNW